MNKDLQKMFIEDSPQDVNNLVGVENLSDLVVQLQKLEDEVKDDEERLTIFNDSPSLNLDALDVQVLDKSLKLETPPLLTGVEILK